MRVAIVGAAGRMGKSLIESTFDFDELTLSAALENDNSPYLGKDAGETSGIGSVGIPIKSSLKQVIDEFDIVISLSARRRDINKKNISIKDFLNILKKKNNTKFGLMFGPEASGLSNKDLSLSNFILTIPTSQKFKSINLSHSVTIICYEIFKALNPIKFSKKGRSLKISSKSKQSSFVKYLISLLEQKDFFLPEEKKQSMILSINNLVYRFEPNDKELRILASIVSSLSKN